MTRYVVLIEDTAQSHGHGDLVFVLLGFYDARSRGAAIAAALEEWKPTLAGRAMVAVPARYWGSNLKPDLTRIRVCEARCETCIFGPRSPITPARREDYMRSWRRNDTFQNCHHGTVTGDRALVCRGFYDWCKATGWEPTAIQLGERLDRLIFVPIPDLPS